MRINSKIYVDDAAGHTAFEKMCNLIRRFGMTFNNRKNAIPARANDGRWNAYRLNIVLS